MKPFLSILISLLFLSVIAQSQSKRVLFIGNSYTYVNNLPQMVADVALSAGDSVIFDSNTIGGYTLSQHSIDATTLSKIGIGNWDYVVLQEQSQLPSFPISQVETDVLPYAHFLDSLINSYNPCTETMFYMTWGRKNGDASNCLSWPPVCTYSGMDSLLNLRYRMMADSNHAVLSPVGAVWNYIRQNYPLIELYQSDESHPSLAGSYAAACCFYSCIFRKDPTLITNDYGLLSSDAVNIRNAAKIIANDSLLNWHIGEYDPLANFNFQQAGGHQILFNNVSTNAVNYSWHFGDGDTSNSSSPSHIYFADGNYNVTLYANNCDRIDSLTQIININSTGISNTNNQLLDWEIIPNPAETTITLSRNDITSYQILNDLGVMILNSSIQNNTKSIDITSLKNGFYYLKLFNQKQCLGQSKFIKISK